MAAELSTKESINFMMKYGRGLITIALTDEKFAELDFPQMMEKNELKHNSAYMLSADYEKIKNGVTAGERALTIKKLLEVRQSKNNFRTPGHIFLDKALKGAVLKKASTVEVAVDLASLAGCDPSGVICEILNVDGSLAKIAQLIEFSKKHDLKIITIEDIISYRRETECYVVKKAEANLPTAYGDFRW